MRLRTIQLKGQPLDAVQTQTAHCMSRRSKQTYGAHVHTAASFSCVYIYICHRRDCDLVESAILPVEPVICVYIGADVICVSACVSTGTDVILPDRSLHCDIYMV